MARAFSVFGAHDTALAADKTVINIIGATTVRPEIYFISIYCTATPADSASRWRVGRTTAAGTATAYTPVPLEVVASLVAECTAGVNHTAEPTYTANAIPFEIGMQQKATVMWYAVPGREIKGIAAAANGLGLKSVETNAGTAIHRACIHYVE